MTAARVLVVGSYNRDVVARLPRWPQPGETLAHCHVAQLHGGKGSNQAVQAARCGAAVHLLAAIGDDDAGAAALALWQQEGVDATGVLRITGARTGHAVVLVESGGENRIALDAGANALLPAQAATARLAGGVRVALGSLEVPAAAVAAAFAAVRAQGGLTVLNAAPMDAAAVRLLAPGLDVLVVNEGEAAALAGGPAAPAAACERLARDHLARHVIVTAGAAGAWGAGGDAPAQHHPARHVDAVDTTGAGDAFAGALAARLAEGADLDEAVRFGMAAGALACTVAGAEPSLHRRAAIEEAC